MLCPANRRAAPSVSAAGHVIPPSAVCHQKTRPLLQTVTPADTDSTPNSRQVGAVQGADAALAELAGEGAQHLGGALARGHAGRRGQ